MRQSWSRDYIFRNIILRDHIPCKECRSNKNICNIRINTFCRDCQRNIEMSDMLNWTVLKTYCDVFFWKNNLVLQEQFFVLQWQTFLWHKCFYICRPKRQTAKSWNILLLLSTTSKQLQAKKDVIKLSKVLNSHAKHVEISIALQYRNFIFIWNIILGYKWLIIAFPAQ